MNSIDHILELKLVQRDILAEILKWLDRKEAIILTGSRQVGKTSIFYLIIQHLVKDLRIPPEDIFYFDLEKMDNLETVNGGVDSLLQFLNEQNPAKRKKYVFIDEVHYLDDPSNLIKVFVDHYSDEVKLFATGSSVLNIKRKFKDSLVGRKMTFEIFSLNFCEYLGFRKEENLRGILKRYGSLDYFEPLSSISHNKILTLFYEYALYGGYPAIVLLDSPSAREKYLGEIYTSYVRKDINALFFLENITAFNKVVKLMALNIGNLVNIHEVSKEAGVARQTLEKYLAILENTYICRFVQPFFTNKQKEIVKMSKVYFYDTGLRNRIVNDFRKPDERVDGGFLMENVVFKSLLKRAEDKENIKYWRMKYGVEVDFIIDEQKKMAFEVKLKETGDVPDSTNSFLNSYKMDKTFIINKKNIRNAGIINFLPYYVL